MINTLSSYRSPLLLRATQAIFLFFMFLLLAVNFSTGDSPGNFNYPANYVFYLTGVPLTLMTLRSAEPCYILFVIVLALCLPGLIIYTRYSRRNTPSQFACDLAALVFLVVWTYGIMLGLARGNNLLLVIRNFAASIFYVAYFILVFLKISPERVFKATYWAAMYVMFLTIILSVASTLLNVDIQSPGWALLAGPVIGGGGTSHARIFCVNQMVLFVLVSIAIYRLISLKRRLLIDLLLAAMAIYATLFVPAMRGNALAVMVILFCLLLVAAAPLVRLRVSKRFLALLMFIVLGSMVVIATSFDDIVRGIFLESAGGNAIRYEQSRILLDECTVFGKGLGAEISTGYSRAGEKSYGFEVIYINIFHKYGVFALLLLASYFYTFYGACRALVRKTIPPEHACCALGAMGYTLVAFGNPMLFGPNTILLHCIALYLIRQGSSPVVQLNMRMTAQTKPTVAVAATCVEKTA
ncbi:MAG: hypothetical protein V1899_10765 [Planctomycetota bacterium]